MEEIRVWHNKNTIWTLLTLISISKQDPESGHLHKLSLGRYHHGHEILSLSMDAILYMKSPQTISSDDSKVTVLQGYLYNNTSFIFIPFWDSGPLKPLQTACTYYTHCGWIPGPTELIDETPIDWNRSIIGEDVLLWLRLDAPSATAISSP